MKYNIFVEKLNSEYTADLFVPGDKSRNEKIILKYLESWNSYRDSKMLEQENALEKLFIEFADNSSLENVLLKVSCLNDFYSTNIKDTHSVAKIIFDISIDNKLKNHDLSVVNEIADSCKNESTGQRREFSFASKYCSFLQPEFFPIYDSRNKQILKYYAKELNIKGIKLDADYLEYVKIIDRYKKIFSLEKFSYKEIDRFNWIFCNKVLGK